jgi:hypothetical protein
VSIAATGGVDADAFGSSPTVLASFCPVIVCSVADRPPTPGNRPRSAVAGRVYPIIEQNVY